MSDLGCLSSLLLGGSFVDMRYHRFPRGEYLVDEANKGGDILPSAHGSKGRADDTRDLEVSRFVRLL
jgi:hypothetical protein